MIVKSPDPSRFTAPIADGIVFVTDEFPDPSSFACYDDYTIEKYIDTFLEIDETSINYLKEQDALLYNHTNEKTVNLIFRGKKIEEKKQTTLASLNYDNQQESVNPNICETCKKCFPNVRTFILHYKDNPTHLIKKRRDPLKPILFFHNTNDQMYHYPVPYSHITGKYVLIKVIRRQPKTNGSNVDIKYTLLYIYLII